MSRVTARCCTLLVLLGLLSGIPVVGASESEARVERLLSQLGRKLDSDTTISIDDSGNQEAKAFIARANEFYDRSSDALYSGDLDLAEDAARDGLRAYQTALDTYASANKSDAELAEENAALMAEIDAYHQGFKAALAERGPTAASLLDEKELSATLGRARDLDSRGQHREAQGLLQAAQQSVTEALTKLRNNETLVYSLDFRTPADEYRYESDRYGGYIELAEKLAGEVEIPEMKMQLFNQFRGQGEALAREADAKASRGEYQDAIGAMEDANKRLIRGLQILGLPVSY